MATVKQYVTALQQREFVIARKLGSDVRRADKGDRVLNTAILILLSTLIKTLVDKGVITDGELSATLDGSRDDIWDDVPKDPPLPE